ncbi:translation initiation factor IF-2 [Coxiella endosymbiont of Amblyomma sculptum]|uniref:translation initiation factor IF-2 n=1 Tax=Coxiella endosymbiont of Amblyomma sculptum TaxID=2487929 RepID=UPI00132E8895|nr:translation initiation factor IF-2 [Coxiella endosymbiont of Amblyomma sculptum]QHG92324.1 translation initiation factor IF-2 [Coxiella endosymbiont of Amblyomma sculptum]
MNNIVSVKKLAELVRTTPENLLKQLKDAGIAITHVDQTITNDQKQKLLLYLRTASNVLDTKHSKIVLKRKKLSVVRLGKKRINVEIRSKHAYEKSTAVSKEEILWEPSVLSPKEQVKEKEEKMATYKPQDVSGDIETITRSETNKRRSEEIREISKKIVRKEFRVRRKNEEDKAWTWDREELHMSKFTGGEHRQRKTTNSTTDGTIVSVSSKLEHGFLKPTTPIIREVVVPKSIVVSDLAQRMSIKASAVIKTVAEMGVILTTDQCIDQKTAETVVRKMGHRAKLIRDDTVENDLEASLIKVKKKTREGTADLSPRSPIVTIMGHVDHGKTSLLDCIRKTKTTSTELGGITQHIGAYHVNTASGAITFLDTPGHEAFTTIRARGAKCTDIVVLVVAADDGVMPQTIEAIQHARTAKVPFIVAINKMDKTEADPNRIKIELSKQEIVPEEWGGETLFQLISAKTGEGIDSLLECILLQAEMLELKSSNHGLARGTVIESRLDKKRGPVATILVMSGELRLGDTLLVGQEYGRVRAMIGDDGHPCLRARPSIPVEVLGLSNIPTAGEEAVVVQDERKAREIARFRQWKNREIRLTKRQTICLESVFDRVKKDTNTLNIVLKSDVQGSLEALLSALDKLSSDTVQVNFVSKGIGSITESDVHLAIASNAVVIGFNVRADTLARSLAEREGVVLRYYDIIYNLIDSVKKSLDGLSIPEFGEKIVGLAQVREVFRSSKLGAVAGCIVTEGVVRRHLPVRILRDNVVIYEGKMESLRRYKEDVAEVHQGIECGVGIKSYDDIKVGDQIEAFEKVQIERRTI